MGSHSHISEGTIFEQTEVGEVRLPLPYPVRVQSEVGEVHPLLHLPLTDYHL